MCVRVLIMQLSQETSSIIMHKQDMSTKHAMQ